MLVVGITRWAGAEVGPYRGVGPSSGEADPLHLELPRLAELLEETVYDLRLRLAGPLPLVALETDDEARARRVFDGLWARGHGVVVVRSEHAAPYVPVRSVEVEIRPRALLLAGFSGGTTHAISIERLLAIVRAERRTTTRRDVQQRPASSYEQRSHYRVLAPPAALTTTSRETVSRHALYLFHADDRRALLLPEDAIRYASLGDPLQPTARLNFENLVDRLRDAAPRALYDRRLVLARRRSSLRRAAARPGASTQTESNAATTDLAALLIGQSVRDEQARVVPVVD